MAALFRCNRLCLILKTYIDKTWDFSQLPRVKQILQTSQDQANLQDSP